MTSLVVRYARGASLEMSPVEPQAVIPRLLRPADSAMRKEITDRRAASIVMHHAGMLHYPVFFRYCHFVAFGRLFLC